NIGGLRSVQHTKITKTRKHEKTFCTKRLRFVVSWFRGFVSFVYCWRWEWLRRSRFVRKRELVVGDADRDRASLFELPEQNLVGERIAHFLLHDAAERPRAEHRIVA